MSQLRIIYFALITSTFVYAIVIWVVLGKRQPEGTFDQALRRPMVLPLVVISLATFAVAFALRRQPWITRWAITESIIIYGLVGALLTHDWRVFVFGWLLSLIGFALAFPRAERA